MRWFGFPKRAQTSDEDDVNIENLWLKVKILKN
jgi:hypothetical protein